MKKKKKRKAKGWKIKYETHKLVPVFVSSLWGEPSAAADFFKYLHCDWRLVELWCSGAQQTRGLKGWFTQNKKILTFRSESVWDEMHTCCLSTWHIYRVFCNASPKVRRQLCCKRHKFEEFFSFSELIYSLPRSFLHNTGFSQADKTHQQTPLQRFVMNRLFMHVIICRKLLM